MYLFWSNGYSSNLLPYGKLHTGSCISINPTASHSQLLPSPHGAAWRSCSPLLCPPISTIPWQNRCSTKGTKLHSCHVNEPHSFHCFPFHNLMKYWEHRFTDFIIYLNTEGTSWRKGGYTPWFRSTPVPCYLPSFKTKQRDVSHSQHAGMGVLGCLGATGRAGMLHHMCSRDETQPLLLGITRHRTSGWELRGWMAKQMSSGGSTTDCPSRHGWAL